MLKLLGVCGSPRKKSSHLALQTTLEAAAAGGGIETELVELRGRKINFCIHCNKCLRERSATCVVYHDDMDELYDKVYRCDGLVCVSPVYDMNITAQLTAFFNRFRPAWILVEKDPYLFARKVGAAIAVGGTRNGGQEAAIGSILGFYHTQGFTVCNGGGGVYAGASLWNPGDGSGTMDDPYGLERCEDLGHKLAFTMKAMNGMDVSGLKAEFRLGK